MTFFNYQNGSLCAEQMHLDEIARQFGTPCYVYSRAHIEQQWHDLDQAFGDYPHTICYAVKANSNIAVLNLLVRLGSGFDIVSEGELRRVLLAGGAPSSVVYSGVAKSEKELEFAIESGVRSINIESQAELERVQNIAQTLAKKVSIALRVNPDVDPQTHPYISTGLEEAKFGIPIDAAHECYLIAAQMPNIQVHGIACHIGSQITNTQPFVDSLERVLDLLERLEQAGIAIEQLDLGGGLGIDYQGETPPDAHGYINSMLDCVKQRGVSIPVAIEPGRCIVGNAGVLLTKVEYLKSNASKNFAIVDAGMNDLLRPSLYQAFHQIVNVKQQSDQTEKVYDIVGPICESADVLGYNRSIKVEAGDLLAVMSAGAYAQSMASNYNSRGRAAEVIIDQNQAHCVRQREPLEELTRGESILP